jgi:hypothetical protein
MVGQSFSFGTAYNNVSINEAFVEESFKNLSADIDNEL